MFKICCPFLGSVSVVVVVDSLFIVAPNVFGSSVFSPCFVMKYLVSFLSLTIILMMKRELVALLKLYS